MSPEEEALRRIVEILDRHKIPYMLTGSLATSYHGRPRATHDADVVIDPLQDQLAAFVADLEREGFYVNTEGARAALEQRRQFNADAASRWSPTASPTRSSILTETARSSGSIALARAPLGGQWGAAAGERHVYVGNLWAQSTTPGRMHAIELDTGRRRVALARTGAALSRP